MSVSAHTRGCLQLWSRLPPASPTAGQPRSRPCPPPGTGTIGTAGAAAHPRVPICTSRHCAPGGSQTCRRLRPVWPSLPAAVRAAPCPCPDTGGPKGAAVEHPLSCPPSTEKLVSGARRPGPSNLPGVTHRALGNNEDRCGQGSLAPTHGEPFL